MALVWGLPGGAEAADCKSTPASGADWEDCDKSNIILRGADLRNARLSRADLSATDLRGASLGGAVLEKATLIRTSLAGASANGARFDRVEAYRSNFSGLQAEDASFANSELQRANFAGATLHSVNFEKAELGRAVFVDAVLADVRFTLANLSRADLRGAASDGTTDFASAFMYLTRIEGLDLSGATGLEQVQLDLACGDADTQLPTGLTAPAGWPCKFE